MSVPGPPNVVLQPYSSPNAIEYAWDAPSQPNGTIQTYKLTVIRTADSVTVYTNSSIPADWYGYYVGPPEITLTNGITYSATLQAINQNGEGEVARFQDFQPGTAPYLAPSTVTATVYGTNSALVTWAPPAQSVDATIFWYTIFSRSTNPSDPVLSYTADGINTRSYFISGLNQNSSYYFEVNAVNCPGYSPPGITPTISFIRTINPSEIPSLNFWLDATSITGVSCNAPISSWTDKSPSALVGTALNGPLYITNSMNSNPVVRFNGTNQYINFGNVLNIGSNNISIFAVAKYRTTAAGNIISKSLRGGATNRYALVRDAGVMNGIIHGPSGVVTATTYADTSTAVQLVELTWDRATNSLYRNGTLQQALATVDTGNFVSNYLLYVAAYQNDTGVLPSDGLYFDGDMAEIIMYSNVLTTFRREQIEGYLAWKWGFQNNLYLGHPFRYAAPLNIASVPFVPTMIDGVQVWYDGADPLGTGTPPSSGSAVTTWFDKAPFARNASAVVAGNYSNDSPKGFINFNGTSTYYTIPTGAFIANQYFSFFIVERLQAASTTATPRNILSGNNNGTNTNLLVRYTNESASNFNVDFFNNGTGGPVAPFTTAAAQPTRLFSFSQLPSSRAVYLYGSNIGSDTNNSLLSSWNNPQIGRDGEVASRFYSGHMKEILIYTGQINGFQRQQVEGYLAWKWGLQTSLPLYHPFYNAAPTSSSISVSPLMVNGLNVWLDASDSTTFTLSGSNVSQWRDKSGFNNNFTPISGTPTRLTDGSLNVVNIPSGAIMECANSINITTNYYMFFVNKVTGIPGGLGHIINSPSSGSTAIRYQSVTSQLTDISLRGAAGSLGTDVNDWITTINVNGSRNTTTAATYTNYHMFDGQIANAPGNSKPAISGTFGSRYYVGRLCEILIYNTPLSTSNVQVIQGYLAWKWGLQTLLPTSHPYYSAPPTSANVT